MELVTVLKAVEGGALFVLAVLVIWERIRKSNSEIAGSTSNSTGAGAVTPPTVESLATKVETLIQELAELQRAMASHAEKSSQRSEHFDDRGDDIEEALAQARSVLSDIHKIASATFDMHDVYVPGTKTPVWFLGKDVIERVDELLTKQQEYTSKCSEKLDAIYVLVKDLESYHRIAREREDSSSSGWIRAERTEKGRGRPR